jgi:hypothetical protein
MLLIGAPAYPGQPRRVGVHTVREIERHDEQPDGEPDEADGGKNPPHVVENERDDDQRGEELRREPLRD